MFNSLYIEPLFSKALSSNKSSAFIHFICVICVLEFSAEKIKIYSYKPLKKKIIFLKISVLKKCRNVQFFVKSCNFLSKKRRKVNEGGCVSDISIVNC